MAEEETPIASGSDPEAKSVLSGTIKGQGPAENTPQVMADPSHFEEIYVDGVAGMTVRSGVVKLECYRVIGQQSSDSGSPREVRRVTHRLVLPALALNELAQILQRSQALFGKAPAENSGEEA